MKSQIPEVTLPCDLPTWSMVQEYLVVVQAGVTSEEMIVAMLRIYDICNVSPHVSDEGQQSGVDDHIFDDFKQVIENGFSPRERERFLSRTLPCMARYALSLAQLRPTSSENRRFRFNLKGDSPLVQSFDRRFVASAIANMFFSTFPRPRYMERNEILDVENQDLSTRSLILDSQRYLSFHILFGENLSAGSGSGTRLLKKFLNYFDTLDCEEPCGHLKVERYVTNPFDIEVLRTISSNRLDFPECQPKPLAPIFIMESSEQIDAQTEISSYIIRDITTSLFLQSELHPELLILLLFSETLLPNEFIRVSSILSLPSSPSGNIITDNQGKAASTNHLFDISTKVQHNQLFEEVRNALACIKTIIEKEKDEAIIIEEDRKSSTFSSKSSLLEKMVDKFSSSKEIDTQDISAKCSSNEKQDHNDAHSLSRIKTIPEKIGLVERVNILLEKNNNYQSKKSNFKSVVDDFRSRHMKTSEANTNTKHTSNNSDMNDQSYPDSENHSENQRIQVLETFCLSNIKRCISDDSWSINTFNDIDLLYDINPASVPPKSPYQVQRSRSCEMFNGLFQSVSKQSSKQDLREEQSKLNEETNEVFMPKPIWISGKNMDTFRFLIEWLAVSLSDIPLVILELQPSSESLNKQDEANKNIIAKICIEADKKGWTTSDLMAIISREYFQNTNESVEDCARRTLYFNS